MDSIGRPERAFTESMDESSSLERVLTVVMVLEWLMMLFPDDPLVAKVSTVPRVWSEGGSLHGFR